jgi:hypothetical protein
MNDVDAAAGLAVARIREAFPPAAPPPPEELSNHCPECQQVAGRFAGKLWPEVSVGDLRWNFPTSLIAPKAFRYYLPALMLRCVEAPDDLGLVTQSVISDLAPPGGKPQGEAVERLSGFSTVQVEAILAFLRWCEAVEKHERAGPDRSPEAIAAIPVRRPLSRALSFWSARR